MIKKFIFLIAIIGIGGFLIIGKNGNSQPPEKASNTVKSDKVIDFTLKDLDGNDVSLKNYRGKYVLLNIWATWCGPCRYEIPDLIRIRKKYQDKGFEIIGIVVSSKEKAVKKMVEEYGITYPVVWGTAEALAQFGPINAIPRTFLLNKEGKIVEDILGSRDYNFFDTMLKKYLQ